jgi:hypothetical protein
MRYVLWKFQLWGLFIVLVVVLLQKVDVEGGGLFLLMLFTWLLTVVIIFVAFVVDGVYFLLYAFRLL